MSDIKKHFDELNSIVSEYIHEEGNQKNINDIIEICTKSFENNNGVYFCGNGGSAAEAMHLAAEFSGRYKMDRRPLKSDFLAANTSFMTAVSNDYGFDHVFSRAIESVGSKGDVLFLLSTSGNSKNIINAAHKANEMGVTTIALTGRTGGDLAKLCNHSIKIPSDNVPRIQELHLLIGHIICEEVEKSIFAS